MRVRVLAFVVLLVMASRGCAGGFGESSVSFDDPTIGHGPERANAPDVDPDDPGRRHGGRGR